MRVAGLPVQLLKFRGTTSFRKMNKNLNRKNVPAVYRKYPYFDKNTGTRNVWALFEGRLRGVYGTSIWTQDLPNLDGSFPSRPMGFWPWGRWVGCRVYPNGRLQVWRPMLLGHASWWQNITIDSSANFVHVKYRHARNMKKITSAKL